MAVVIVESRNQEGWIWYRVFGINQNGYRIHWEIP